MSFLSWFLLIVVILILLSPFLISFVLRKALSSIHFAIKPRGYFTYARIALFLPVSAVLAIFMKLGKCRFRIKLGKRKPISFTLENLELTLLQDGNNEKYMEDSFLKELYAYGEQKARHMPIAPVLPFSLHKEPIVITSKRGQLLKLIMTWLLSALEIRLTNAKLILIEYDCKADKIRQSFRHTTAE